MADNVKPMSALQQIKARKEKQQKRKIECACIEGIDLYVKPLMPESYLEANKLNEEKDSAKRTRLAAKLICDNVIEADGRPAFLSPQGDAVEQLATNFDPLEFWELFASVFSDATADRVKETEKKP